MPEPSCETVRLKAADGHAFDAYRATPPGKPRGGIVVVQEIFGINPHVQAVTREYAAAGYLALAPALFDRIERDLTVPYTDSAAGLAVVAKLRPEQPLHDLKAAIDALAGAGKVGMVGYCWG